MSPSSIGKNKVVYIVVGRERASVNDRVEKIYSLKNLYDKMVLVTIENILAPANNDKIDNESIAVKPFPNPTWFLSRLGLKYTKQAIDRFLYFPSRDILYVKSVQRKLKSNIENDLKKKHQVCVLTCMPPHDIGLVGLFLKKKFPEIRWIIDWQDLWSYDENYFEKVPELYKNKLLNLEKEFLTNSDVNVTTNFYAKQVLEQHYKIPSDRIVPIHHHFCRADLPEISKKMYEASIGGDNNKKIKIGFLGTLFKPPRVPGEKVLEAISYVRNTGINIELHVHGHGSLPESAKKFLKKTPHANNGIVFHNRTSHKESLAKITQYDFLLLVLSDLPNCRAVMSIKLPHYLLVGRPIIAIVPDSSAMAAIIRETQSGYVIPAKDDWGKALVRMFSDSRNLSRFPQRNESSIKAYDWKNISNQWINII